MDNQLMIKLMILFSALLYKTDKMLSIAVLVITIFIYVTDIDIEEYVKDKDIIEDTNDSLETEKINRDNGFRRPELGSRLTIKTDNSIEKKISKYMV